MAANLVGKAALERVHFVLQGKEHLDPVKTDAEQVFLLFAAFGGDVKFLSELAAQRRPIIYRDANVALERLGHLDFVS